MILPIISHSIDMTSTQNTNKNPKKYDRKTTNVTNVRTKLNYKHTKTNDSSCNLHCAKNYWERVPRNFHNPYPICYLHRKEKITDPLLSEILFKQEYKRKLENIKSCYKHNLKRGENTALTYCYTKLQKLLTENGDEHLHNDSKWFYVGNMLDVQTTAPDTALVFHVVNNTLSISDIERKDSCWSHRYTENIDGNLVPIYQIDTLRNISTTLVCARHKYNISRYTVTENNGKICGKLVDTNSANVPFIGLTLNKKSQSEYATVDIAQTVKIWDNRSGKEILCVPHDDCYLEENDVAQVLYQNIDTLAYVNSCSIDLIDTRTGNLSCCKIDRLKLLQVSDKFCNMCMNTENEFFCYICTHNSVMQLDFRTKGVVNMWSHTFKKPPFLSFFSHQADCNVVCMSSYKQNEKFLLYHSADKYYIPTYLPTLTDSFESFAANCPQKDASMYVKQRLNISTAGIHVLKSYDNLCSIFSANSLGDVYCQDITKLEQNVTNCTNGPFKKWNRKIQKFSETEESLNVVDKLYLKHIHLNANFRMDSTKNHRKTNYLRNCRSDLKCRNKTFSTKLTDAWYEKTEASILENIEELPREVTIKNWLNDFIDL